MHDLWADAGAKSEVGAGTEAEAGAGAEAEAELKKKHFCGL